VLFGLLGNEMRDFLPAQAPKDLPILGLPSGTVEEAVRVLAPRAVNNGYSYDDVRAIVQAYEQVGSSVGVDWFLAIAQMAHETGFLTSYWSARPQNNPAALKASLRRQIPISRGGSLIRNVTCGKKALASPRGVTMPCRRILVACWPMPCVMTKLALPRKQ